MSNWRTSADDLLVFRESTNNCNKRQQSAGRLWLSREDYNTSRPSTYRHTWIIQHNRDLCFVAPALFRSRIQIWVSSTGGSRSSNVKVGRHGSTARLDTPWIWVISSLWPTLIRHRLNDVRRHKKKMRKKKKERIYLSTLVDDYFGTRERSSRFRMTVINLEEITWSFDGRASSFSSSETK
jgi:hypothetical protein